MLSLPCISTLFTDNASQRITGSLRHIVVLALVLTLTLLAGCASGPTSQQNKVERGATGQAIDTRNVPPKARTLYEQATASMAAGDTIDAELRFQEFLLQYPNFPGAHVNLAIIFAARGDDTAAEGSITDALVLDPENAAALNQLGMLLRRQGKFAEAESAYRRALAADQNYALAHYNLAVLNDLYFQRLNDALQHYEQYQILVGDDKQVTKWIADLKRRIGSRQRTANVTE